MTSINESSSPVNIPYLPDDLLLNCLARVSRLYYPTLSLVSKRFRSLVASIDLYDIRKLLGRTENCLYVCIRMGSEHIPCWFTFSRRPTRIPKHNSRWFASCFSPYRRILTNHPTMEKEKKKSSDINLLVSIPPRPLDPPPELSRIAIGSNIYMIGKGAFKSSLLFMDCRSHTLHEFPNTRVGRKHILLDVLDGKVFVVDISKDADYSNLIEFFDPKTQIWEHVPSPSAEIGGSYVSHGLVFDGKIYLFGDKNVVYKPKENKWDEVGLEMPLHWFPTYLCCVIDNVIYSYGIHGVLCWYDSEGRSWKFLKGLKKLPKLPEDYTCVRLVNYGGKIAVLWEKNESGIDRKKKMIWCAVIALEKRNGQNIYGKIEWCDVVLTIPKSSYIWNFTAVNV